VSCDPVSRAVGSTSDRPVLVRGRPSVSHSDPGPPERSGRRPSRRPRGTGRRLGCTAICIPRTWSCRKGRSPE
jgi:hypothetical protein